MVHIPLTLTQKSFIHSVNILLGAMICWYGLTWSGLLNPIWAVITVILVSDPDLSAALKLSKVRSINTIVGCVMSLISLMAFGYSPLACFITAAVTVLIITSIEDYPSNWRLAPVTIVIIMNASSQAATHAEQVHLSIMRAMEIGVGCAVSVAIAAFQLKFLSLVHTISGGQPDDSPSE